MSDNFLTTDEVKRYALRCDLTYAEAYEHYANQGFLMGQVDRYSSATPPFPKADTAPTTKEILI